MSDVKDDDKAAARHAVAVSERPFGAPHDEVEDAPKPKAKRRPASAPKSRKKTKAVKVSPPPMPPPGAEPTYATLIGGVLPSTALIGIFFGLAVAYPIIHLGFFDLWRSLRNFSVVMGILVTSIWIGAYFIMGWRQSRHEHRVYRALYVGHKGSSEAQPTLPIGNRAYTAAWILLVPLGVASVITWLASAAIEDAFGFQNLRGMYVRFGLWFTVLVSTIGTMMWRGDPARTIQLWFSRAVEAGKALGLQPESQGVSGTLSGRPFRYAFDPASMVVGGWVTVERPPPPANAQDAQDASLTIRVGRDYDRAGGLTGDPAFASQFTAQSEGPRAVPFLYLNDKARAAITRLRGLPATTLEVTATQMKVVLDHTRRRVLSTAKMSDLFTQCVAIAESMGHADDIPLALYQRAHEGPVPVRERSLEILWTEHPDTDPARTLAAKAAGVEDPWVRLRGALIANDVSLIVSTLRTFDEDVYRRPEPLLLRGLEAAFDSDLGEACSAHASELVRGRPASVVAAIIRAIDETERPWADDWCRALLDESDAHPALVIARWIEREDPAVEVDIIKALTIAPKTDHTLDAIRWLGRLGTPAGVAVLTTYCDELLDSPKWKEPARRAIAAIQARVQGGDAGQLTLVQPDDARGALSPTPEEGEKD